jgi:uncharacterized protein YraI
MSRHCFPAARPLVRACLALALLCATLAMPLTALADTTTTVREELNLRNGPGLDYDVITLMPAGSAVTVTGDATEGWYPVQFDELTGWAYAAYLSLGKSADSPAPSDQGTATVVTTLLNLRNGPGMSYDVVGQLAYGTTVQIVGSPRAADGHTWLEVLAATVGQGWVAGEYLDAGESAGPQTETVAAPATPAAQTPVQPAAPVSRSGNPIVDIITEAANRYGQSPSAMLAVARCESNLNPNSVNKHSGASGLFQFLPGTWRTTPYASYSIFDPWANANAAGWMWSVGRRGEWVC